MQIVGMSSQRCGKRDFLPIRNSHASVQSWAIDVTGAYRHLGRVSSVMKPLMVAA